MTERNCYDSLIRAVNARIPSSVTPATRIEIHPSEWLTLVDQLNARASDEPPATPSQELDHWRKQAQFWHARANEYLGWYSEARNRKSEPPSDDREDAERYRFIKRRWFCLEFTDPPTGVLHRLNSRCDDLTEMLDRYRATETKSEGRS